MMHFPPARKFYNMRRYRLAVARAAHVSAQTLQQQQSVEGNAEGDAEGGAEGVEGKALGGGAVEGGGSGGSALRAQVPMARGPSAEGGFEERGAGGGTGGTGGSDAGLAAFTANIPTMGMSAAATVFAESDFDYMSALALNPSAFSGLGMGGFALGGAGAQSGDSSATPQGKWMS